MVRRVLVGDRQIIVRDLLHTFLHCFACWVIVSADDTLKYFSYFPQKTGFDTSYNLGDNLHELSKPIV